MDALRDVLRQSLAGSLRTLTPADRLAAAWPVVAGGALASRSSVLAYQQGTLTLAVTDEAWRAQVQTAATLLRQDLARVSGTIITDILVVPMPRANSTSGGTF